MNLEELKEEYVTLNSSTSKVPIDQQLDLDVRRTYQYHYSYRSLRAGNQKVLFNIFHALSLRNSSFEYTQGITCGPSILTLFLDEYSSYAGTIKLLGQKYRLEEMFSNFNLLGKCWEITYTLMQKHTPKILKKFEQIGITKNRMPFFLFHWHQTWFTECFSFEYVLRVFDVILLDGFPALFTIAIAIFHYLEKEINENTILDPNIFQQELSNPFSLLKQPPSVETFLKYMAKHRIKEKDIKCL